MKVIILFGVLISAILAQRPFLPVQPQFQPSQFLPQRPQIEPQFQPRGPPVEQQFQPQFQTQYQPPIQQQRVTPSKDAYLLKYDSENDNNGLYNFAFETSDGQARQESAVLKNAGTENEALSVTGSFSFLAPDGVVYTVRYIADENGFRPEGDHLPSRRTPNVGIPAAALGSLVGGGVGKK